MKMGEPEQPGENLLQHRDDNCVCLSKSLFLSVDLGSSRVF